ncbi:helix-turn-helix domain-containing protein [Crenothrix polyspora]|uniref:Transposase n=1 Tax=Crenothrix polyspora TaxID=360316 RepID=A0A1R4H173_9GAMM|nr:helix-turn-helix domain-containing protein [Crenothrix polyspora]SJM89956.1 transposase [Crenothrix polyspora]
MITLQLTNDQKVELYDNAFSNTNPKIRKKCFIVYLRSMGYSRQEIALIMKVDEDTVTNQVKLYATGGLPLLLKDNYRTPKSQLEPYIPQLKELFDKQPPHTVNQAIDMIEKETGVSLKNSACREFLKKLA